MQKIPRKPRLRGVPRIAFAAALTALTLWTVGVAATAHSLSDAAERLRQETALPLALLRYEMGGEEADLVITDPPYNVNYKDGSIKNDNMDEGSFEDFLQNAFLAMFENMKPGAAAYIFHADSEGLAFRRAFRDAGFKLAECLIWEKNSFVLGRQDYQWRHEPILYGWKEGAAHYFIDDRSQDTILLEDELDLESMKKEDLITYINQILSLIHI